MRVDCVGIGATHSTIYVAEIKFDMPGVSSFCTSEVWRQHGGADNPAAEIIPDKQEILSSTPQQPPRQGYIAVLEASPPPSPSSRLANCMHQPC